MLKIALVVHNKMKMVLIKNVLDAKNLWNMELMKLDNQIILVVEMLNIEFLKKKEEQIEKIM